MTAILQTSAPAQFATFINRNEIEFQLTVVTFDGDTHSVVVVAASKDEAAEIAASMIPGADYVMF